MFFSIALKPFVKKNKPDKNNEKASKQVLNEYLDLLPKPLLELWRKHGFGFYGDYQFRLINPSHWQATADQWVISDDETQRTPIAITAMGELIIYRKMSDAEDIMLLDPVNHKVIFKITV